MSTMSKYMTIYFIFNGFTESSEDESMKQYIDDTFTLYHRKFIARFNKYIDLWNAEFDLEHPDKNGWCREYSHYIFEKYQKICKELNEEINDKYIELWPQLIPEDEEQAMYIGQMEPVYGVRLKSNPKKMMHIEYSPELYDTVEDAMKAREAMARC